jgi:hypothetical protein
MKTQIFFIAIFLSFLNFFNIGNNGNGILNAQNVSINNSGDVGDESAMLDISSTDKGMLIPRVILLSTTDVVTISSPIVSLLVYNTNTVSDVVPGFYYWNGTKWSPMVAQSGVLAFAEFYALMPGDNSATIAVGAAVQFPNAGPTSSTDITAIDATTFQLSAIGTYMVAWQVSITEPCQLMLKLQATELAYTVIGRSAASSQISGNCLITTTEANSVLSVINPTGNSTALTLTVNAGGASAVSASLVITRIK